MTHAYSYCDSVPELTLAAPAPCMRPSFASRNEQSANPDQGPQVLRLDVERFTVPELLLRPSDIGVNQAGLAECIVQSIKK